MWNPHRGVSFRPSTGSIASATLFLICVLGITVVRGGSEQPAAGAVTTLTVNAAAVGAPISATLFGIFFEDINFAADGGIYAEKIKNRSFEFPDGLMGWRRSAPAQGHGSFKVMTDAPLSPDNPH